MVALHERIASTTAMLHTHRAKLAEHIQKSHKSGCPIATAVCEDVIYVTSAWAEYTNSPSIRTGMEKMMKSGGDRSAAGKFKTSKDRIVMQADIEELVAQSTAEKVTTSYAEAHKTLWRQAEKAKEMKFGTVAHNAANIQYIVAMLTKHVSESEADTARRTVKVHEVAHWDDALLFDDITGDADVTRQWLAICSTDVDDTSSDVEDTKIDFDLAAFCWSLFAETPFDAMNHMRLLAAVSSSSSSFAAANMVITDIDRDSSSSESKSDSSDYELKRPLLRTHSGGGTTVTAADEDDYSASAFDSIGASAIALYHIAQSIRLLYVGLLGEVDSRIPRESILKDIKQMEYAVVQYHVQLLVVWCVLTGNGQEKLMEQLGCLLDKSPDAQLAWMRWWQWSIATHHMVGEAVKWPGVVTDNDESTLGRLQEVIEREDIQTLRTRTRHIMCTLPLDEWSDPQSRELVTVMSYAQVPVTFVAFLAITETFDANSTSVLMHIWADLLRDDDSPWVDTIRLCPVEWLALLCSLARGDCGDSANVADAVAFLLRWLNAKHVIVQRSIALTHLNSLLGRINGLSTYTLTQ
jgi:hypothetical protein